MSLSFDKKRQQYRWYFERVIGSKRVRFREWLPRGLTRPQAEKRATQLDKETYNRAMGLADVSLREAVDYYLTEGTAGHKAKYSAELKLGLILLGNEACPIEKAGDVVREYTKVRHQGWTQARHHSWPNSLPARGPQLLH
jgi:hypothetical protein